MASASYPSPPNDKEMRTIIDKLANFVARNGPEFEKMTMSKKRDDPKFGFLFGGDYNPYYRWKVEMERSQTSMISANPSVTPAKSSFNGSDDDDSLFIESLNALKVKEQNDIMTQGMSDPLEIEFNNVVKPVMNNCSKEAIASGESWIISHSHTAEESGRMAHYIMRRSLDYPGIDFNHKLHLVYLINDLLHHCIRKGVDDLKQAIEMVIVQIFYNIHSSCDSNNVIELTKVVDIWDSQEYICKNKLMQTRRVLNYPLPNSQPMQSVNKPSIDIGVSPWQQQQQQQQHFSIESNQHHTGWKTAWEQPSIQAPPTAGPTNYSSVQAPPIAPPSAPPAVYDPPSQWVHQTNPQQLWTQQHSAEPTPLFAPSETLLPAADHDIKQTIDYNHQPSSFQQSLQVFDYQHQPAANWDMNPIPPPPMGNPPFHYHNPPPPFFQSHPPPDIPLPPVAPPPSLPYFDLPAGLIIPLVPLHEHSYAPLKPHMVCLPAPQPPTERLLEAVEEFYYPPSEERQRNDEGWEAKALLDFYEAKTKAKKNMKKQSHDRYRSRRDRSRSPKRRRRRSSSSSSRSRSYSPRHRRRSSRSPSSESSSSSRSYSPQRRHRSPSTPTVEDVYKPRRHESPVADQNESLTEENVGHQLLTRMGWEGAGLGARGQGIQEPIEGGEARDKTNQFAGVGINMKDPFQQFRRNKSYTFNRRPGS